MLYCWTLGGKKSVKMDSKTSGMGVQGRTVKEDTQVSSLSRWWYQTQEEDWVWVVKMEEEECHLGRVSFRSLWDI